MFVSHFYLPDFPVPVSSSFNKIRRFLRLQILFWGAQTAQKRHPSARNQTLTGKIGMQKKGEEGLPLNYGNLLTAHHGFSKTFRCLVHSHQIMIIR